MGNNTSLITKMLVYHERFTRGVNYGKVQNMDQGSMDPLHGPGPWTPFMDRTHGPPIMDQIHGPPIFATKIK